MRSALGPLWWMWLTFFTTWHDRFRAAGYGVLYLIGLAAVGVLFNSIARR